MRLVLMLIGTVLAILFFIQLKKGSQYNSYVEVLDSEKFPLAELYVLGFAWSSGKLLAFKGERAAELKQQSSMIYGIQYSEFYANVVWAQTITFVHLLLTMTFLLASTLYSRAIIILIVGMFFTIVMGAYCYTSMKNNLSDRSNECDRQLPDVVSSLAILVNSGMVLKEAWTLIAENGQGAFYELMKSAADNMNNGYSDSDAIFVFGRDSGSTEIKKFSTALIQSMEKGGGELGVFLANESSELWHLKRQKMLQEGEKAAAKLLLPIMLIFLGILLIIISAAFSSLLI